MTRTDYILNNDFTFQIKNGDFVRGDGSFQYVKMIINQELGEDRFNPTVATGASQFINADTGKKNGLLNRIKDKLTVDGFLVRRVYIDQDGAIRVNAK